MTTIYDPPSGWRYGFPKPYKPMPGESLEETLLRDGYPLKEFGENGKVRWVRFWETDLSSIPDEQEGDDKAPSDGGQRDACKETV